MCVDPKSADKHARRISLKHRFRRSHERSGERMMRETVRGRVHVPTALAAVEAGVIDTIDPEELVSATRIPRILCQVGTQTEGTAEAVINGGDLMALHMLRKVEQARHQREFAKQHPYATCAA